MPCGWRRPGYDLVLAGDRREPLEAVRREIGTTVRAAAEVRIAEIDLARTGAAEELHAFTEREGIAVDVLINNAGIFSFLDILRTPAERIERIILLHDLTNTQLCRLYAADMARRGRGGHILNMSSYSLWMPFPGLSLYSASKAYLRAFSVAFAKEVRDEDIRVTAVCPAGVATDLYGLTPRWQRIGLRLGVLISADSAPGGTARPVAGPPHDRPRLVEPHLDSPLQTSAHAGDPSAAGVSRCVQR